MYTLSTLPQRERNNALEVLRREATEWGAMAARMWLKKGERGRKSLEVHTLGFFPL